jgi:hypothetical protein
MAGKRNRVQAVAYVRASSATNVGADKDSEPRQRRAIERFAKSAGFAPGAVGELPGATLCFGGCSERDDTAQVTHGTLPKINEQGKGTLPYVSYAYLPRSPWTMFHYAGTPLIIAAILGLVWLGGFVVHLS